MSLKKPNSSRQHVFHLLIKQRPDDWDREVEDQDVKHLFDILNQLLVEFVSSEIQPMIVHFSLIVFHLPSNGVLNTNKKYKTFDFI